MSDAPNCRGSFALGSACGFCPKCRKHMADYAAGKKACDALNTPSSALRETRDLKAQLTALQAENARLRAGLLRIATPEAFYVATRDINPEAFARMIYAEKVLAGTDLELADKETEAETRDRYPLGPVNTQET